ncbi:hypothetical protein LCGC14_0894930 [marine sediment metagenome]|uniref:Uncharacterized protein n=1 Tax=marine sediment metagenome TaxID=412755 RepID=A0A0F9S523_9ZZZZ
MIKIAFQDKETGVTVFIEADAVMLLAEWKAVEALGIKPKGCYTCTTHKDELPSLGDSENGPGPGQLPENWNPDDYPSSNTV